MRAQAGRFYGVAAMLTALFISFPIPSGSAQGFAGGLSSTMRAFVERLQGMPGEFRPYGVEKGTPGSSRRWVTSPSRVI